MHEQINSAKKHHQPRKESDLQGAIDTLDALTTSDSFLLYLQQQNIDTTDDSSPEYLRGVYDFSQEFLRDIPNEERNSSHILLELMAIAPYASQSALELNRKTRMPNKEYHAAKDATVKFGMIMANYMEQNPGVSIDSLTDALAAGASAYSHEDPNDIHATVRDKVRGARVEYAFGELMSQQDFLAIRRGTEVEDRKGIDFVATLPDGRKLIIDTKASLDKVAEENGGYMDKTKMYAIDKKGRIILFPLMNDTAFEGNTCRLRDDMREGIQMQCLITLQQAAGEIAARTT